MRKPLLNFTEAQKDRSLNRIAAFADRLGSYDDYVLFGAYQEGVPHPATIGYLVYVLEKERLVFTQIVSVRKADRPRVVDAVRFRHALTRYALRQTKARLEDGDFALGEVYTEEPTDWALVVVDSKEKYP